MFLHALLRWDGNDQLPVSFPVDELKIKPFKRSNTITNPKYVTFIEFLFQKYKQSGLTLDEFFDREIVVVRINNGQGIVRKSEFSKKPLILAKSDKNQNFLFGDFQVTCKKPIKMPLSIILDMGNYKNVDSLDFTDCVKGLCLVKVENGVAFTDGETTSLEGDFFIGKNGNDYFWIPDKSCIERRFYCRKLPSVCCVYFKTKYNRDNHEPACKTETQVKTKQVTFQTDFAVTGDKTKLRLNLVLETLCMTLLMLVIFRKNFGIIDKNFYVAGTLNLWNQKIFPIQIWTFKLYITLLVSGKINNFLIYYIADIISIMILNMI